MSFTNFVRTFAAPLFTPGDAKNLGIPTAQANSTFTGLLTVTYWLAGVIAVIVIVVAGFMYVTSGGDPAKVVRAKNAILYAVIGLVVIILAFIITGFVTGSFS